jgi:hypothetical protein
MPAGVSFGQGQCAEWVLGWCQRIVNNRRLPRRIWVGVRWWSFGCWGRWRWSLAGRWWRWAQAQCAALAVDAGRLVPVEVLANRVWGSDPPPRARRTLHTYLTRMRRLLEPGGEATRLGASQRRVCVGGRSGSVDVRRFRRLFDQRNWAAQRCTASGSTAPTLTIRCRPANSSQGDRPLHFPLPDVVDLVHGGDIHSEDNRPVIKIVVACEPTSSSIDHSYREWRRSIHTFSSRITFNTLLLASSSSWCWTRSESFSRCWS